MVPADGMEELISRDLPQAIGLLKEMNENAVQVAQLVDDMLERVKRGELSTAKGLSFLEVKYHMLLSYLINLTYVVLRKCSGEPIEADPAIDRLVELRTVLEKTKPIDHKLKYQVDKLVKAAVTGVTSQNDPTQFKPNPDDMAGVEGGDESDEDEATEKATAKKSSGVYVPPRLASVPYDGETTEEREQRQTDRAKIRALSSSMIEELKEEYLDTPLEIAHGSSRRAEASRQYKERQTYEENYFTRLPVTKKDAHKGRRSTTIGSLGDELTHFGDFKALESSGSPGPRQKATKRKLTKYKGKKNIKKKRAQ